MANFEHDYNLRNLVTINKLTKSKDNQKILAELAINKTKYHFEQNGHNHLSNIASVSTPALSGVFDWLTEELSHLHKRDFNAHQSIDELKKAITDRYQGEWIQPTIKTLDKIKSWF